MIATSRARSFSKLADLKERGAVIMELDVTDSLETLKEVAHRAVQVYGRVDVVVNNAGMYRVLLLVGQIKRRIMYTGG